MNRRYSILSTGAGLLVGLVALATAVPANAAGRANIDELVPAFAHEQTAKDRSLKSVNADAFNDLDAGTVRWIGTEAKSEYWVARQGSKICLVVHVRSADAVVGMSCGELTDFDREGLPLLVSAGADGVAAETYLLPADVEASQLGVGERGSEGRSHLVSNGGRANLVASEPGASGLEHAEVARDGRSAFTFEPLDTK